MFLNIMSAFLHMLAILGWGILIIFGALFLFGFGISFYFLAETWNIWKPTKTRDEFESLLDSQEEAKSLRDREQEYIDYMIYAYPDEIIDNEPRNFKVMLKDALAMFVLSVLFSAFYAGLCAFAVFYNSCDKIVSHFKKKFFKQK